MTIETRNYIGAPIVVEVNRRWSIKDIERMHILIDQGLKNSEMAFYLDRSPSAIRSKRWRLRGESDAKE